MKKTVFGYPLNGEPVMARTAVLHHVTQGEKASQQSVDGGLVEPGGLGKLGKGHAPGMEGQQLQKGEGPFQALD